MRTQLNQTNNDTGSKSTADNNRDYRRRHRGNRNQRNQRPEWPKVERITVEQAEKSVRIRFPAKPSETERDHLKAHGFSWSGWSGFWYARLLPQNVEFALKLESDGFPNSEYEPNDNLAVPCGAD